MGTKGHPLSGGAGGGGGGGWKNNKKKMAILAVLLLVGVMGLMVVQKVRDRRMFNLVIKDKDRQILSLHLLLQKERQYVKEHKKKNQDLNAKLFSLRTQKTELDNKMMEMRSMIGSLRDEQRALELTIDEKQNEIKHKESKINHLKTTLHSSSPPKILSVTSDDPSPSNREANLTSKVKVTTNINPNVKLQNASLEHEDDVRIKMNTTTTTTMDPVKETRGKDDDEEGEREVDVSMESSNGSEADQDYKEEIED
ncbi:unnamed protein product [Lactuca saligna]|uniref:Uncharacterized protein n=1 Tax=Lactuca saligna TaxID=75948 RepID=A0AA35YKE6_LACSI|nr:unnamed protein product [Lactuca saligna]